jgi:putative PIN family toxin of toxin-antitoxin system
VIRAVVDANVIISSVIAPLGPSRRVFDAWRKGVFALVTTPGIIEEVSRRLAHPRIVRRYSLTDDDRLAVIRLLLAEAIVTPGSREVGVVRDPTDDKVIAAALEAGAEYIVSGDEDLLTLGDYEGVIIVTPSRFVVAINDEQTRQ